MHTHNSALPPREQTYWKSTAEEPFQLTLYDRRSTRLGHIYWCGEWYQCYALDRYGTFSLLYPRPTEQDAAMDVVEDYLWPQDVIDV